MPNSARHRAMLTSPLEAMGRDSQPISVRVHKMALATCQAIFVDCNPELLGNRFNVGDVEMDEGVGPRVALVLGKIDTNPSSGHRDEPWKPRLKLVLPLFREAQPGVPRNRAWGFLYV